MALAFLSINIVIQQLKISYRISMSIQVKILEMSLYKALKLRTKRGYACAVRIPDASILNQALI